MEGLVGNQEASAHILEVPDSGFAVDIVLEYLQYRLLALSHYDHGTAREIEAGRLVILGHILQDGTWWATGPGISDNFPPTR